MVKKRTSWRRRQEKGLIWLVLVLLRMGEGTVAWGQVLKDAQDIKDIIGPRVFATPAVSGMSRSKGVIFRYEALPPYEISSRSANEVVGGATAKLRDNERMDLRLFLPFMNKPAFKAVAGLQYSLESFDFPTDTDYPFYTNLTNRRFRVLGGQVVVLHSFAERSYAVVRVKGSLNGDYNSLRELDITRYMRYSMEAVYGWQSGPNRSYGGAVQISHNYGRTTVLPAIIFNRTFNDKWGLEAVFPAQVAVRRNISDKTLLFMGYGGESMRYNMRTNSPSFAGLDSLQLRRIDVRARLRWEQEIYDFLWFGLESGLQVNLRHRALDDFSTRSRNALIFSRTQPTPFLRAEIFLVPPRRFSKKR